jgi:serine/threonine-protein phosphatase 2B catalytic subunit
VWVVTEMLLAILSICSQEELDSESDGEGGEEEPQEEAIRTEAIAARRQAIKSKIMAVGRMQKVFQILRFVFSFFLAFLLIYIYILMFLGLVYLLYREEAENATELETDSVSGSSTGVGLNVQGTRINRSIRTFADA